MIDYPCDKFADCSFSCFSSIDTHRQTLYTPATIVGVTNKCYTFLQNAFINAVRFSKVFKIKNVKIVHK